MAAILLLLMLLSALARSTLETGVDSGVETEFPEIKEVLDAHNFYRRSEGARNMNQLVRGDKCFLNYAR